MEDETKHRVVVATNNPGKLLEIRTALAFTGWEFVTAQDLGADPLHVEEDGETFTDNALIKAYAYRDAFRMPALADDSGLVVDTLKGDPGVRTSRYAGEAATDSANNAKLLAELASADGNDRNARFSCAVVYVDEHGMPTVAYGLCRGQIAKTPRGARGFGYDPIFLPDATPGRSMAELGTDEKNLISPRGNALRALREEIAGS